MLDKLGSDFQAETSYFSKEIIGTSFTTLISGYGSSVFVDASTIDNLFLSSYFLMMESKRVKGTSVNFFSFCSQRFLMKARSGLGILDSGLEFMISANS